MEVKSEYYSNNKSYSFLYPSDLKTNGKLITRKNSVDFEQYKEETLEKIYDGICIRQRVVKTKKSKQPVYITLNAPYLLMSFKLEGDTTYKSNKKNIDTSINEREHQIFLFSDLDGIFLCDKDNYFRDIEFFISIDFIKKNDLATSIIKEGIDKIYHSNISLRMFPKNAIISSEIQILIEDILNIEIKDDFSLLLFKNKTIELLIKQIQNITDIENNTSKKGSKIVFLKNYIDTHFKTTKTLKELSEVLGINVFDMQKEFKQNYKTTVHHYFLQKKMEYAKEQLLNSEKPILEIAEEIGYAYSQHFTREFKKHFEVTPKQYRLKSKV